MKPSLGEGQVSLPAGSLPAGESHYGDSAIVQQDSGSAVDGKGAFAQQYSE
jgi:hypothetical protein